MHWGFSDDDNILNWTAPKVGTPRMTDGYHGGAEQSILDSFGTTEV